MSNFYITIKRLKLKRTFSEKSNISFYLIDNCLFNIKNFILFSGKRLLDSLALSAKSVWGRLTNLQINFYHFAGQVSKIIFYPHLVLFLQNLKEVFSKLKAFKEIALPTFQTLLTTQRSSHVNGRAKVRYRLWWQKKVFVTQVMSTFGLFFFAHLIELRNLLIPKIQKILSTLSIKVVLERRLREY